MEKSGTSCELSKGPTSGHEVCRRLISRLLDGLGGIVTLGIGGMIDTAAQDSHPCWRRRLLTTIFTNIVLRSGSFAEVRHRSVWLLRGENELRRTPTTPSHVGRSTGPLPLDPARLESTIRWFITDECAAVGGAFHGDTATGICRLRKASSACDRPASVIHRQEVRPMNAVSAVGAPLQFTMARLR
jgi:hypothetical protein